MELMDILETDYFKTCLYEAIDGAFKSLVIDLLPGIFFGEEEDVEPVKFLSILMMITQQMTATDDEGSKQSQVTITLSESLLPVPSKSKSSAQSLNQMVKYVFFDDDKLPVYQRVTLEDLENFDEKQLEQANGGDDGIVNQLLSGLMGSGGGGDQGLMSMLGSIMKDDKMGEIDGEALDNSNVDDMIRQLA
mmetsp:Transcript_9979/g.15077  ORF Transcript_9979/g.15077 Transcript_9979/m.15077 type:complete len:191 (-) Transcript_9979:36-608(-)